MNTNRRLLELDSLRGIASVAVMLFHFSEIQNANSILPHNIFKYGATGVDLFFMISGFVIFKSIRSSKNLKAFWISRFNRLFPTYWLSILIAIISFYVFENYDFHKPWNYFIGNFLMMQPLFFTNELVYAYWTLYPELIFYITISLIWSLKFLNNIESLVWSALVVMLVINGLYLAYPHSYWCVKIFILARNFYPLICYFSFFASGIIYNIIYEKGFNLNRLLLLTSCFFMTLLIHNISGKMYTVLEVNPRLIFLGLYNLFFILIVLKKSSFLKQRWLIFFGSISYPMYLIHQSFGFTVIEFLSKSINIKFALIVGIILSIFVATAITKFFEPPIHKWIKNKLLSS